MSNLKCFDVTGKVKQEAFKLFASMVSRLFVGGWGGGIHCHREVLGLFKYQKSLALLRIV